jgi:hypothetical protein
MALPMLIRAEMVSGAGRRSSRCAVALPAAQHTRTPPHRRCPRRHAVSLSLCVVVPQTLASLAVVSRPPISVITRVATFQGPRRWSLCPPRARVGPPEAATRPIGPRTGSHQPPLGGRCCAETRRQFPNFLTKRRDVPHPSHLPQFARPTRPSPESHAMPVCPV